ncbi:hypothetical protein EA462_09075 [Natrarchaeobius halalkaliphilus]|uniref:Uncharacterized protein n=1 Tax=Natrarchaeobius halalkaliphilus TaxID=1679091 RepID=A0A3N6MXA4_9EURY|nr:hypothetical protein [Natrarchaeobius halalkaliphilus]RQG90132.1 hypothetical protein EA462_09075 [Natrarchaeobius halalkaliphilus]
MIWPVFLSLFWAGIATAYVSVVRREVELLFAGLSFLCWLGVAFSSTSIQVAVGESLETVGEPGLTATTGRSPIQGVARRPRGKPESLGSKDSEYVDTIVEADKIHERWESWLETDFSKDFPLAKYPGGHAEDEELLVLNRMDMFLDRHYDRRTGREDGTATKIHRRPVTEHDTQLARRTRRLSQ